MTKPNAAPSMMTPSRRTSVAAVAGSGGIGADGPGCSLGRGFEGEQDRGMARGEPAGVGEEVEAGPVAGIVAPPGKKGGKRIACCHQLGRAPPDRLRAH